MSGTLYKSINKLTLINLYDAIKMCNMNRVDILDEFIRGQVDNDSFP